MAICPRCKTENAVDAKFCKECSWSIALHDETAVVVDDRRPVSRPVPTSLVGGKYQVTGFLGEGASKKVYLVRDRDLDREVAFAFVKVDGLASMHSERVQREARTMARLGEHPNIVPIYEYGEENGQPYMILPHLEGGTVRDLIGGADSPADLETVLGVAMDTCQGLEFAYAHGVVHRDVKPTNIWLTEDPSTGSGQAIAQVGDFGIAVSNVQTRLTRTGDIVGTIAYASPEQVTGEETDHRTDLYSLGVMLYEMVTGTLPFQTKHVASVVAQIINKPPAPISQYNLDCPGRLKELIMGLLEKHPNRRPQSAAEVLSVLESIEPVEAEGGASEQVQVNAPEATALKVLLVAGSEFDSDAMLGRLLDGGFLPEVHRWETPAELTRAVEHASWDVVIADYSSSEFRPIAVKRSLEASGIDLPVISVSDQIADESATEAMDGGIRHCLTTATMGWLAAVVRKELRDAEMTREKRRAELEERRLRRELEDMRSSHGERVLELSAQSERQQLRLDRALRRRKVTTTL